MKTPPVIGIGIGAGLGLAALVGFGVYKLVKAIKGNSILDTLADDVKTLQAQGQRPNLTKLGYEQLATQIYNAWRYSAVGDDKSKAESLLKKPINDLDVRLLIAAYGKRQGYAFSVPVGPEMTLPEAVRDELSSAAVERINQFYATRGIQYRF